MVTVSTDDIAVELGRAASSPEERAQWERWIARAVRLLQQGAPSRGIDLAAADPLVVDDIVTLAVAHHARNPDGRLESVDVSVDDGRESRRWRAAESSGLTILDEWWSWLLPDAAPSGAFSVRPGFEVDRPMPDVWLGWAGVR